MREFWVLLAIVVLIILLIATPKQNIKDKRNEYDSTIAKQKSRIDTIRSIISKRDTLIVQSRNNINYITNRIEQIKKQNYDTTTQAIITKQLFINDSLLFAVSDSIRAK